MQKNRADVPVKVKGEVTAELIDIRTGEIEKKIEQDNLLLYDYLNQFFTVGGWQREFLGAETFGYLYLGNGSTSADRSQIGLQGEQLINKEKNNYVGDDLEIIEDGMNQITLDSCAQTSVTEDGNFVVTCQENELKILEINSAEKEYIVLRARTFHEDEITSISLSATDDYILTSSKDGTAKIIEFATLEEVLHINSSIDSLKNAAFSNDDNYILVETQDNLEIFEIDYLEKEYEEVVNIESGGEDSHFFGNDRYIVTSRSYQKARVFGIDYKNKSFQEILAIEGENSLRCATAFENTDEETIFVVLGERDGEVSFFEYNINTEELVKHFEYNAGHIGTSREITMLRFALDGKVLISGSSGYSSQTVTYTSRLAGVLIDHDNYEILDGLTLRYGDLQQFCLFYHTGWGNTIHNFSISSNMKYLSFVQGSSGRYTSLHLGKLEKIMAGAEWILEPGEGTGEIREAALRTDYSSDNCWVSRVVFPDPITKEDYHRLKFTWMLSLGGGGQVWTGTIAQGQRDGSSLNYSIELLNHFYYGIFCSPSGIRPFFEIRGTPEIDLGIDNTLQELQSYTPSFLSGKSIEGESFEPFYLEAEPYEENSLERKFRVGIEADKGNAPEGLAEVTLAGNGDTIMRITFDPPLDKINTYRFYFDINFKLLPD